MQNRDEMIKYCYRLLLDRWPSEAEWSNCPYENIDELRDSILMSNEFYDKHRELFESVIIRKLSATSNQ